VRKFVEEVVIKTICVGTDNNNAYIHTWNTPEVTFRKQKDKNMEDGQMII
jgi:hypothetical protein